MQIGVFPAAGAIATSTVTHLSKLVPPATLKPVFIARHPEKLKDFTAGDGTLRTAAWESSVEELTHAFEGIDCLLLISYPSHEHELRTEVHTRAVTAAKQAGVQHIFYTSLALAGARDTHSATHVMQAHLDTEALLAQSAATDPHFTYTSLRIGLYSESFPMYTSFFSPKHPVPEVLIPHDGSGPGVAWADRDELGEATARLMVGYWRDPAGFGYTNDIVLLTGPEALSLGATVAELSRIVGKDVAIREVPVKEFVRLPKIRGSLMAVGDSDEMVETWATSFEGIRRGEAAVVSPELERILGRRPKRFAETIEGGWSFHHFE